MYYLAYGSNLNKKHMYNLCYSAKPVGKGIIKGYNLYYNYYADIKKDESDYVNIGIWEITAEDEKMLDFYESFPSLYHKELVEFEFEDGTKGEGLVYIMNNPSNKTMKPSIDYLKTILDGYDDFGIKDIAHLLKSLK